LDERRDRGEAVTDGGVTESESGADQEPNDDWSGRNETWGKGFLVKIEAEGRERVGEIGLLVADKAAVNHLQNTSGYVPSPGRPSKGHLSDTTATFETEHASLTATLYSDTHDEDDAEELFSVIEATLDDASRLDQLTLTVDEDWSRVTEDDDA